MYSLSSSKFTRIAVRIFVWIFAGLMIYSSCAVLSQNQHFPDGTTFGIILYLIGCLIVVVSLIVGPILKKVKNKNSYSTLTIPFSITVFSLLLAFDNFLTQINEFNIIFGACLLVAFGMGFLSIILFKVGEKKAQFSNDSKILSLGKGLFMGAIIIFFVFAILALIGSLSSHPLVIFAMVCLLLSPIISTIGVWTIQEDMYTPSTSIFGSKVKINIKKQTSSTPNNNSNTKADFSDSEIESMLNKNTYTLDDLKVAKQMCDAGKISAQDYEIIKNKYISSI